MNIKICQAKTSQQIALTLALFEEYAAWLGFDLSFQDFAAELLALPGHYAPPQGRLLLALVDEEIAGCAALRPLKDGICEMKRLFVRPAFRGKGIGKLLTERIIKEARAIGYLTMRLDTLPIMQAAVHLYQTLGFTQCGAYYKTPLPDSIFMELKL